LGFFTTNAYAIEWSDTDFTDLTKSVNSVNSKVTGNIAEVADEFKLQVTELQKNGQLLQESSKEFLKWLNDHAVEYNEFAGTPRCGSGTACEQFRADMITFVQDFSLLSDRFPIIEKVGLSDAPVMTLLIQRMPKVLLFFLYDTMNRAPDWRSIPQDLASIYDEIGDPDVFSARLSPLPGTAVASANSFGTVTSLNVGQTTPTERFCENHVTRVDNGMDPVRLNRINLFISLLATTFNVFGESLPKDQGLTLLGEGGSVPFPNTLKMVAHVIGFIQQAIGTFHSNLEICRAINDREIQLQIQVAQCIELADFILPGTRDEIYDIVTQKIEEARSNGMPVAKSDNAIVLADNFRRQYRWKEAYLKLCDAYKKIGE